ncbi:MAG: hypothetical protein AAF333_05020 [Planctomycetota bacterium]
MLTIAVAAPATAIVPAELLTPELERREISLSRLDGGQLNYFDAQRRLTAGPAGDFVRLSLSGEDDAQARLDSPSAKSAPLVIELIDGQQIAGRWSGAARDGEAIEWTHPTLGRFTLGLDEVQRVTRRSDQAPRAANAVGDPATAQGDTVVLNNGDRLVGFVIAVDEGAVTIQPDGADDSVRLPIDNVAYLGLANPVSSATVAGDLITLADGTRVRGTGVAIVGDTVTFTPTLADAMRPVDRPLAELRSVDFAASRVRLVDLMDQPMELIDSGTAFGLSVTPAVRGDTLHLRAPMTVRYVLPEGVRRFAAKATLDLPDGLPTDRARWANVGLSVGFDTTTPVAPRRWVLRPGQPGVTINLPLPPASDGDPGRRLTLEIDPAAHGPVLDRLRLTDAVLLVDQPEVQPGTDDPDR